MLRGSTLRRRLARTLEGEAGVNDPVAVILVIGFIDWIQDPHYGVADMALLFVEELGVGLVVGLAVGFTATWALRRVRLASAGLYPLASLAAAALAYGGADAGHGSGFLAVFLCGMVLGSSDIPARRTIVTFHDGMAWLAQLGMFFTLGLLVFPSRLGDVAVEGTVLALVAAAVARPLAVLVALPVGGYSVADRLVLGWAGLRGAVPVVLATFPVIAGVDRGIDVFDIVFFAVVREHGRAGRDLRAVRAPARRHERRAGAAGAARGLRRRAPAGRRGAPVRGAPGRRGGRAPGARPGPAARRAAEPHRPRGRRPSRRAGRPSSSPATTCTCWSARRRRSSSPASCGAGARARWRGGRAARSGGAG